MLGQREWRELGQWTEQSSVAEQLTAHIPDPEAGQRTSPYRKGTLVTLPSSSSVNKGLKNPTCI